jgi:hypothetical protein
MKHTLVLSISLALIGIAGTAQAQSQVIQMGDSALTCPQIVHEASQLADAMGGAPEGGFFSSEQAIQAATGYAAQGALMSGAARAVPGIGMLGNALAGAARRDRERREAEAVVARQRWYYLNGLYSGRDCDRILAAAATAPVTPPAQ